MKRNLAVILSLIASLLSSGQAYEPVLQGLVPYEPGASTGKEQFGSKGRRLEQVLVERWTDPYIGYHDYSKSIYTYETGKVTQVTYMMDGFPSQWTNKTKYETTYDANGNVTSFMEATWASNAWNNVDRHEYFYNAFGKRSLYNHYFWDSYTNQWILADKQEYTYDSNGKHLFNISNSYDFILSKWVQTYKTVSAYNANDVLTEDITYEWGGDPAQWNNNTKVQYTFDAHGRYTVVTRILWVPSTAQWVNGGKSEYVYDASGNNTLLTGYQWNSASSQWINMRKIETVYNSDNKPLDILYFKWDVNESKWVYTDSRYEYTYDLYTDILLVSDWDAPSMQFKKNSKATYTYSGTVSNIETYGRKLNVYPNPASDYLIFETEGLQGTANLELTDLHGRKVLETRVEGDTPVSIAHLPGGLYFYKFTASDNISYSGKIVVK